MYYNIPWDPHEWDESGGSAVKVQVLVSARADVNAVDKGGNFFNKARTLLIFQKMGIQWGYPLVMTNSLRTAVEIFDFPINNMVMSHSYVAVYQRVFCFL